MRVALAALLLLAAGLSFDAAKADPYRWCALFGNGGDLGGIRSCYFMTEQQCRATLSGLGGTCLLNPWYTGPSEPAPVRRGRPRP